MSMQFNPIWTIFRTLSRATTLGQSEPGSDSNEGIIRIPQCSNITGTSPSDCLVSHPRHTFGKSYLSAEMQLVYSITPADRASDYMRVFMYYYKYQSNEQNIYAD